MCCWLTDALTTALMKSQSEDAHSNMINLLKMLVSITEDLKGPSLIRELVFELMTRVVRKTRCLLKLNTNV